MTWPICVKCKYEFIPIQGLSGCPWCSGKPSRHGSRYEYDACPDCGRQKQRESRRCHPCAVLARGKKKPARL